MPEEKDSDEQKEVARSISSKITSDKKGKYMSSSQQDNSKIIKNKPFPDDDKVEWK